MSCRRLAIHDLAIETVHDGRRLVDGCSLDLEAGSSLALVGESGAGKSMTSLAVMDCLPPGIRRTGGRIVVNDQDILPLDEAEKRRFRAGAIGMVMQNPMSAFDPLFTLYSHFRETMLAAGRRHVEHRALAAEALAEVGLPDPGAVLDAYPFQLSGGMLQRAMIALALINAPDYLIADEPTTDLDLVSQKVVLDVMRERCRARHLGLLLITHDLSVAAAMAETIAIMHRGRVVETGPAERVLAAPAHPYARALTEAHRRLYGHRLARLVERGRGREEKRSIPA